MIPPRVAILGVVCAAVQLWSVNAFAPAGRISHSGLHSAAAKNEHRFSCSRSVDSTGLRLGAASSGGRVETAMSGGEHDLYVVGAGYLGKRVGAAWHEKHPEAKMYGETRSYTRHQDFMPQGMTHLMRKNREEQGARCPNLVFCANPGGNDDYAHELYTAMTDLWDGTGMFVFTSSGSVFAEKDGGVVNEESPLAESVKSSPLGIAERVCLDGGGTVVRLAGLYSVGRGPHGVWLQDKRQKLNSNSEGLINLISYEDAAMAVVAALDAGLQKASAGEGGEGTSEIKGRTFLAADDEPTSRRKICELAKSHPRHSRKLMPKFLLDESPSGFAGAGATKVYDSSVTRRDLGWEPRHRSISAYFDLAVKAALGEEERVPENAA